MIAVKKKPPQRLIWLLLSYRNELANVGDILMIHGEARGTGSLTSCQSLAEGNGIRKKQSWTCAGKEYSVEFLSFYGLINAESSSLSHFVFF